MPETGDTLKITPGGFLSNPLNGWLRHSDLSFDVFEGEAGKQPLGSGTVKVFSGKGDFDGKVAKVDNLVIEGFSFEGVDEQGEKNGTVSVKEFRAKKATVSKQPGFTNEIDGLLISDFEMAGPVSDAGDDISISLGSWQMESARFGGSEEAPVAKFKDFSTSDFSVQMGENGSIFADGWTMEIDGDRFDLNLDNAGISVSAEAMQSLPFPLQTQIKRYAPAIHKSGISFHLSDHSYIDEPTGRFHSRGAISSDQLFSSTYRVEAENVPYYQIDSDGYLDFLCGLLADR